MTAHFELLSAANNCNYKNIPKGLHKHALECPFQTFYCSTCYGAFGAEVITHSCTNNYNASWLNLFNRLLDGILQYQITAPVTSFFVHT